MANLPLAFSELLAGGIFLAAAATGDSVANVVRGTITAHPLPGGGESVGSAAAASEAGSGATIMGDPGGAGSKLKLIGFPFTGTHTLGNWQSDRAVDVAEPKGTPVYAAGDGRVTRAGLLKGGTLAGTGQFDGYRLQLEGPGNSFWYGHLSRLAVGLGATVKKGQLIGYTGAANGVQHLHFAALKGNVEQLVHGVLP